MCNTKKRINNLRDTLVGKVPDPKSQVEQIMIALIFKFMNDMDKESAELGGKASFFVDDMPVIIRSLNAFFESVINVPDFETKDDLTLISILFNLAS